MPRKSKIAKMSIEEYQPKNTQVIQEALKDLLGDNGRTFKSRIRLAFRL